MHLRLEAVDLESNALYEYLELKHRATGARSATSAAAERADARRADAPTTLYLGRDRSGAAAAMAWLRTPLHDHTDSAELWIGVEPRLRRFGVGAAMLGLLEEKVREARRTRVTSFFQYREGGDDAAPRFADRHGFASVQQMGIWFTDLAALAATEAPVPEGYRLETHVDELPEDLLEARAAAQEQFCRDVPQGDADRTESWDTNRMAGWLAGYGTGQHLVESLALTPDGRIAGFTDVVVRDNDRLGSQQDTYVARAHRGHGLGRALKVANATVARQRYLEVRRLRTFVAEDNGPMNRVNEALGYEREGILFDVEKELE